MSVSTLFGRLSACAGLIGILGATLSGCGGGSASPSSGGGNGGGNGGGGTPSPTPGAYSGRAVCAANPHQAGRARWTILIYMQAANNLQPFSLQNVAQLASVGSNADLNIVLQWKQIPASQTSSCGGQCAPSYYGVRRYLIHAKSQAVQNAIKNSDTTGLQPDRLPDPPNTTPVNTSGFPDAAADPNNKANGTLDMGDWHSLHDFVQWGTRSYPADNVALVVWDHGSGWRNVYRSASGGRGRAGTRAVAQDDETQNEIETWQLPGALSGAVQPIDMLVLDCSLEQMTEVAYEVRNSARLMVGSEESPPGPGYPYDRWLSDLKTNVAVDSACDVGHTIIQDFATDTAYLSDPQYRTEVTQSMLDLTQMGNVAGTLNRFGATLFSHTLDQATILMAARNNAQHYASPYYSDNKDLYDYADQVRTTSSYPDLQQAALAMQNALTGTSGALLDAAHGPVGQNGSHGLAVYVPANSNYLSTYSNLALFRDAPQWPRFLQGQTQ